MYRRYMPALLSRLLLSLLLFRLPALLPLLLFCLLCRFANQGMAYARSDACCAVRVAAWENDGTVFVRHTVSVLLIADAASETTFHDAEHLIVHPITDCRCRWCWRG
jgi:hypothetical protein